MYELQSAVYRRTEPWGEFAEQGGSAVARELGRALGEQINTAICGLDASQIGVNMVVSTMLDLPFTSGWITWPEIAQSIALHTPACPQNFVSAYECSSWGFVLRYAKSLRLPQPLVVINIIDLNIFDFSYWRENPNWGHSGFGIATLVLRSSDDDMIHCQVAKSANGFGEFCLDLRNYMAKDQEILVTPPFFPSNISALYDRLLPPERLLPNRVAEYGHSFGCDPWIALIEQRLAKLDKPGERYLATSVSLNGYWALAELQLAPNGTFLLQDTLPAPR